MDDNIGFLTQNVFYSVNFAIGSFKHKMRNHKWTFTV